MSSPGPPVSPTLPVTPSLPTFTSPTTSPESDAADSSRSETGLESKYNVASHSVRITKHGYAIEPVELRYQEILTNLSSASRRSSDIAFDSSQIGHTMLRLIRGFWSQPAFPKGHIANRLDKSATVSSILAEFSQFPMFPHRATHGGMGMDKVRGKMDARARIASKKTATPKERPKKPDKQPVSPKPSPIDTTHYYSWIPYDKVQISELVTFMCQQMEKVFSSEPRILNIGAPCTVLGDIHGNLLDLRTYERSLWPKAPVCLSCNYLFLGDYVDRGEYSVECVLYLFAMKLISPKRFFLLRGNHEVASIQRQYTFGRECETKFGQEGRQLWRQFNKVFDLMPIAAIVDGQIFCAHGGIPRSVTDVKRLASEIPSPLDNPEVQCPAAWEILWNDPITDSELIGMIEMDNAVVTQTQITQIQPGEDGRELVTTSSGTTAIALEEPAPTPTPSSPPSQAPTPTLTTNQRPSDEQRAQALESADSILNREPPGALSFYIRPDASAAPAQEQQQASKTAAAAEDTGAPLGRVPSDTSSIASTSPQQMVNDGFVANIKRGTAFLFSDQAINHFLKTNGLSHVIRAHEVIPTGFAFHGNGRVITIFSSSKYCGLNNQAACCLVDQHRIRILRLDTGEAGE